MEDVRLHVLLPLLEPGEVDRMRENRGERDREREIDRERERQTDRERERERECVR